MVATSQSGTTLGIIAGRGKLPAELARAAAGLGRDIFILALQDQADESVVSDFPHGWVRLGDGNKALRVLRDAHVEELVFAGGVTRPSLLSLRLDARATRFLAKVGIRALGDDSLLTAIIHEFEAEGFKVIGADTIWSEARMPAGQLGKYAPTDGDWQDIRRGVEVASALGRVDVGQGVVVQQGIVLTVEAAEGTDAMLKRAATLKRKGVGGTLVKIAKPQQDRRVDLPTIGLDTLLSVEQAGLKGIAVEAGNALLLDQAQVITAADRTGLFVYGIDLTQLNQDASSDTSAV